MRAILHNIRSMHNVGSMFRTADAAGIERLYLTGYTPAPTDEWGRARSQLTKVSLGAEKIVAWKKHASATRLIEKLKKHGHRIIAIEQHKNAISLTNFCNPNVYNKNHHGENYVALYEREKRRELVLVMGNEVRGLSPAILKRADAIIEIPMRGKKESLNVAVAFGIATYWFLWLNLNHDRKYHGAPRGFLKEK